MNRLVFMCLFLPSWFWGLLVLSNTYIAIYHDKDRAAFYIKTIEGDPSSPQDDNAYLLYHKLPPTTLTSVRINNETFLFGSDEGNYQTRPHLRENNIVTEWSIRGVSIEQILTLAPNPIDGISNHVRISYKIKNTTRKNVSVGIRLLLDVYLRNSGVSTFDIPGKGKISKETLFYQESIPEYWHTSSPDKSIKVRGSLKGLELTTPSQIIFASWNKLYDNLWDVPLNTAQSLKASSQYSGAVAIFYNPVSLVAEQTLFITTLYGIHTEQSFTTNNLSLSLILPEDIKAPPIPLSAELSYSGSVPLDIVHLTLTPPKGFTLAEEDTNTITYLKISSNESRKAFWNLQRTGSIAGNFPVKVTATAISGNTTNSISGTQNFFINYREIESLIVTTNISIPTETNKTTNVPPPTLTTPIPSPPAIVALTNIITFTNTISLTNIVLKQYPPHIQKKIQEIQALSQLIEELQREYTLWVNIYRNSERLSPKNMEELKRRIKIYEEKIRQLSQTNI